MQYTPLKSANNQHLLHANHHDAPVHDDQLMEGQPELGHSYLNQDASRLNLNALTKGDFYDAFSYLKKESETHSPPLSYFAWACIMVLNAANTYGLSLTAGTYARNSGKALAEICGGGDLAQQASGIFFLMSYLGVNVFVQHESNKLVFESLSKTLHKFQNNTYLNNLGLVSYLCIRIALTATASVAVYQQNLDTGGDLPRVWLATVVKSMQLDRSIDYVISNLLPFLLKKTYVNATDKKNRKSLFVQLAEEGIATQATYQTSAREFIRLITHGHNSEFTLRPEVIATLWVIALALAGPYSYYAYALAMRSASSLAWVTCIVMDCLFAKSSFSALVKAIDTLQIYAENKKARRENKLPHAFYRDRELDRASLCAGAILLIITLASLGGAAGAASEESGINMYTALGYIKVFGMAMICALGINYGDSSNTLTFLKYYWTRYAKPMLRSHPATAPSFVLLNWILASVFTYLAKENAFSIPAVVLMWIVAPLVTWLLTPFNQPYEAARLDAAKQQWGEDFNHFMRKSALAIAEEAECFFEMSDKEVDLTRTAMVDGSNDQYIQVSSVGLATAISQEVHGRRHTNDSTPLKITQDGQSLINMNALFHRARDLKTKNGDSLNNELYQNTLKEDCADRKDKIVDLLDTTTRFALV